MPKVFHEQVVLDDLFIDPAEGEPARIPYSVQEIFYEMTLEYLLDQPEDTLLFCSNYFNRLKNSSKLDLIIADPAPEDVLGDKFYERRSTIWSSDVFDDDVIDERPYYEKSKATRVELKRSLREILLFKQLDNEDMDAVVDAMRMLSVERGQVIIAEGEEGNECFLVQTGMFHAVKKKGSEKYLVKSYVNGGFFGELALLHNCTRSSTVTAQSEGILWALDRTTFRSIVLKKDLEARKSYEKLIRTVPMLSLLTPSEKDKLMDSLETKHYKDTECIMKEGDEGDGMYFVIDGNVTIRKIDPNSGQEVEVNYLGEGQFFGEVALVLDQPRSASAYASGKATLAFIRVDRFERLLGPCIDIMKRQFDSYEETLKQVFGNIYTMSNL